MNAAEMSIRGTAGATASCSSDDITRITTRAINDDGAEKKKYIRGYRMESYSIHPKMAATNILKRRFNYLVVDLTRVFFYLLL